MYSYLNIMNIDRVLSCVTYSVMFFLHYRDYIHNMHRRVVPDRGASLLPVPGMHSLVLCYA